MMNGIVVVNKPNGLTSHDVVDKVRKKFRIKKVGHAGTLDPLATGVLVMLIGKTTKLSRQFTSFDKAYRATMKLGVRTDTADTQGKVIATSSFNHITREQVEYALQKFIGGIEQIPPMVSAVRMRGKRLYELARQGIEVTRESRPITIHVLRLERFEPPLVEIYLECSKGTYVRQLADDIGSALGCGACITQIERTKVGEFSIEHSVKLEELNERHIRPWEGEKHI